MYNSKIEKIRTAKKVQNGKIENVAGSVWLILFLDGTVIVKQFKRVCGVLCLKGVKRLIYNWHYFLFISMLSHI
jgi:hypothetical protein